MLVISPITSRLAQRTRGRVAVDDVCIRSTEVAPPVGVPPPPMPVFVEDELQRVTSADEMSTLEEQMAWLEGTTEFTLLFKDFCDRLGIHFGFHVGVATETGWYVELDGFRRIIDRVAARGAP